MSKPLAELSEEELLAKIKNLAVETRKAASQGMVSDREDQARFSEAFRIAEERGLKEKANETVAAASISPVTMADFNDSKSTEGTRTR